MVESDAIHAAAWAEGEALARQQLKILEEVLINPQSARIHITTIPVYLKKSFFFVHHKPLDNGPYSLTADYVKFLI